MKKILQIKILVLVTTFNCYAQLKKSDTLSIFIDLKSKLVQNFGVANDSSHASFSFYYRGFESKKKREEAIAKYNSNRRNIGTTLPSFFVNFWSATKPENLRNIDKAKLTSLEKFVSENIIVSNPAYVIYRKEDGTFDKWKIILLAEE